MLSLYMQIDAVICWVDGEDPALLQKRMEYATPGQLARDDIAAPTRYASRNEITYCVCSLLRNVPFLHAIYIITDGQDPPVWDAVARNFPENRIPIRVVDHKEIFRGYEQALPVFCSGALETVMWRIEGLSEWFLYLNDDFAVTAPLTMEDFFCGDRPVVYGYWHRTFTARLEKWWKSRGKLCFRDAMLRAADAIGTRRFVRVRHTPRLYHKPVQERFYREHPDLFVQNLSFRFRSPLRLDNNALVATLMALEEGAVLRYCGDEVLYMQPRKSRARFLRDLERCRRLEDAKFFCVNSLDKFSEEDAARIQTWLARKLDISI